MLRTLTRSAAPLRTFSVSAYAMSVNASGLTAEESKALPTRQAKPEEKAILANITDMYSCRATDNSFSEFTQKATFHDPVGIAEGLPHIREQFFGLAKLFEKATIDKQNVLDAPSSIGPNRFLVDQTVTYYRKADSSPTKTLNSLLTIDRDSSGKIEKLSEDWEHTRTSTSEDGFFGTLNEWRKKATVKATGAFLPS